MFYKYIYYFIFLFILCLSLFYLFFNKTEQFNISSKLKNTNQKYNWQSLLKNNWQTIRDECLDTLNKVPITNENRNKYWDEIKGTNVKDKWLLGHESIDNTWLNYGLIVGYDFIQSNSKRCPKTTKLLKKMFNNNIKIKVAGFSWLRPNSYIPYHTDPNDETVYHLGLLCPKDNTALIHVKMKDNNNKNTNTNTNTNFDKDLYLYQKDGEIITFDDRYPHSAINKSSQERIILYLLIE